MRKRNLRKYLFTNSRTSEMCEVTAASEHDALAIAMEHTTWRRRDIRRSTEAGVL